MGSSRASNEMRAKIFSRLRARGGILNETSSVNAWHWWFYSRTGAWDGPGAAGVPDMLAEEAMPPVRYAPASGFSDFPDLRIRPGESARLKIVLVGSAENPVLAVGEGASATRIPLPSLKAGERKSVVTDESFSGVGRLSFSSADGGKASVRVSISKLYR